MHATTQHHDSCIVATIAASMPVRADPLPSWVRVDLVLVALGIGLLLWLIGDVLLVIFAGVLAAVALTGLASS